jgi:RsiW-degrading membrane proteinase PrsW (M82 family)
LIGLNLEELKLFMEGKQEDNAIFPYGTYAFQNFFRAAFLEEGLKFALLIFICVKLEALDEPIDAIVYGAAIGLGYAAMENLGYLYAPDAWSLETVKGRYYPLVMHLGFGVVMGWLLSLNLFDEPSKFKRRFMLILSLAIPVIFHGVYNYYGTADTFPILTIFLVIGIIFWERREQMKKITESEDKYKIFNSDSVIFFICSLLSQKIIPITKKIVSIGKVSAVP